MTKPVGLDKEILVRKKKGHAYKQSKTSNSLITSQQQAEKTDILYNVNVLHPSYLPFSSGIAVHNAKTNTKSSEKTDCEGV